MFSKGLISPIRPVSVFEASDIEQSFRHLQNGDHLGKAVVSVPEDSSKIPSTTHAKPFTLDAEASYLLTGGLGGLGRSVATWMVERGARNLIFLSRSAGIGAEDQSYFAELNSMGCAVSTVAGKAEDMESVKTVIAKSSKPIKGIVHLAMVLRVCYYTLLSYQSNTNSQPGRSYPRPHLRRMDHNRRAKGRRRLESTPRLLKPISRLLHHGQLTRHPHRSTRPRQLRGRKHLPRVLHPIQTQAQPTRLRSRHLPHRRHRLRRRKPCRQKETQVARPLLPPRARVARLHGTRRPKLSPPEGTQHLNNDDGRRPYRCVEQPRPYHHGPSLGSPPRGPQLPS